MKEKIFKLLNTQGGSDFLIGRELLMVNYEDFIKKNVVRKELSGKYYWIIDIKKLDEFFGKILNRQTSTGTWTGLVIDDNYIA